jgi:signal transduction histidine kinase
MIISPFRICALALFSVIIGAWLLIWPLPDLGFQADPQAGVVLHVAPATPAASGGLQAGDQIRHIYGFPWEAINTRLIIVPLPWVAGTPTPVVVQRGTADIALQIVADQPTPALQWEKFVRLVIALTCLATGYLLGISPRSAARHLQGTAWFWLLLGGALGIYQLVFMTSYVLSVVVLWFMSTVLAPMAVLMHVWYPSRPVTAQAEAQAHRWLWGLIALAQVIMLAVASTAASTTHLLRILETTTFFAFLTSFLLSALVLGRAYQTTTIAHVQRQIRLIAAACMLVGCTWALLRMGATLVPGLQAYIPYGALPAIATLVPCAYLVGGISPDLFRLDRIVRQVTLLGATVVILLGTVFLTAPMLVVRTPAFSLLVIALGIVPLYRLLHRLTQLRQAWHGSYAPLHHAAVQLGRSLDPQQLATSLSDGIRATFAAPSIAIYGRTNQTGAGWDQLIADAITAPAAIDPTILEHQIATNARILPAGQVQHQLRHHELPAAVSHLVFHDAIHLWGLIRHANGTLLGLVLIGPRGDLDPYRDQDLWELQRLLTDAGLAFTNSVSYAEQVQAKQTIAWLYQRVQDIHAETVTNITREIHDDVVNVNVRFNIASLERLVACLAPGDLRDEIQTLLTTEQDTSENLRSICKRLRPVSVADPLALGGSLRHVIELANASWHGGMVRLHTPHRPVWVSSYVQRELIRIAREAITNAIKHADAKTIEVTLCYPTETQPQLTLSIRDHGRATRVIAPREGHWGLEYMWASAQAIGASIVWQPNPDTGTTVVVTMARDQLMREAHPDAAPSGMPDWSPRDPSLPPPSAPAPSATIHDAVPLHALPWTHEGTAP